MHAPEVWIIVIATTRTVDGLSITVIKQARVGFTSSLGPGRPLLARSQTQVSRLGDLHGKPFFLLLPAVCRDVFPSDPIHGLTRKLASRTAWPTAVGDLSLTEIPFGEPAREAGSDGIRKFSCLPIFKTKFLGCFFFSPYPSSARRRESARWNPGLLKWKPPNSIPQPRRARVAGSLAALPSVPGFHSLAFLQTRSPMRRAGGRWVTGERCEWMLLRSTRKTRKDEAS